jgi:hypothetical protein
MIRPFVGVGCILHRWGQLPRRRPAGPSVPVAHHGAVSSTMSPVPRRWPTKPSPTAIASMTGTRSESTRGGFVRERQRRRRTRADQAGWSRARTADAAVRARRTEIRPPGVPKERHHRIDCFVPVLKELFLFAVDAPGPFAAGVHSPMLVSPDAGWQGRCTTVAGEVGYELLF